MCVRERKEREGGRYGEKEKELWAGEEWREGDGERNEMEGLKDKERGEEREGREGEGEIE